MNLNYELSKVAEKDLEEIWIYTFETWSNKQADKYINEIIQKIQLICKNPEIGRQLINIKADHRMLKINSHLIIYKVEANKIKIDRVLHQRMEIKNNI